jgi:V8-like Glu-specific endopeptidase
MRHPAITRSARMLSRTSAIVLGSLIVTAALTAQTPIGSPVTTEIVDISQGPGSRIASYTAMPLIVAAGDINGPVYRDQAFVNNRGNGYDGVVSLQLNAPNATYICTGTLLWTGLDILTAAHCPAAPGVTSVIANFFPGPFGNAAQVQIASTSWSIKPGYDPAASAIQANDLAIIHLPTLAPVGATRYELFGGDPIGRVFDVVGFGARGSNGVGATESPSFTARRHGYNAFELTWGDLFGPQFDPILLADFDDGTATHDAHCKWFDLCQRGVANEANTAGGDSGGPAFIDGRIAGVTSFGVCFKFRSDTSTNPCSAPPDLDGTLNSSFGELSGWVRPDALWVQQNVVPEPSTWLLLATGLGVIGLVARRRAS